MATAFESIKQGLTEAITHAQSKGKRPVGVKLFRPQAVDVSGLRSRLGFSQEQFASRFGFLSPRCGTGSVVTDRPVARHWCCSM